jgi:micrococcal nuclease
MIYVKRVTGKFGTARFILYVLAALIVCILFAYSIRALSGRKNTPPTPAPETILTVNPIPTKTYIRATLPPAKTPTTTQVLNGTATAPEAECIPTGTAVTYATVIGITDGDTITVQFEDGTTERVRYIGMDTPERGDALSEAATKRNAELAEGKLARLVKDVSEVDRFDRLLRYVIVEGVFVNEALLREGLAWAKSYPPDTDCNEAFRQAQALARDAQVGVWSPSSPYFTPIAATLLPGVAICNCSGNTLSCTDFDSQAQAQACFDYCVSQGVGDVHVLDGDGNGIVCEGLP